MLLIGLEIFEISKKTRRAMNKTLAKLNNFIKITKVPTGLAVTESAVSY